MFDVILDILLDLADAALSILFNRPRKRKKQAGESANEAHE